ncbi:MAG: hypothetical protein HRU06_13820 [Oceanospirillaceae bacterium]|nr:hypothetical protein [Oceanospirillaceae bacterium]
MFLFRNSLFLIDIKIFLGNVVVSVEKDDMYKKILTCLIAMLMAGCLYQVQPEVLKSQKIFTKHLRGTLYIEKSQYKLRLCGSGRVVNLLDKKNKIFPHIFKNDEFIPSLYIEFEASAIQRIDWQLEKLYFVSKKPNNCGAKVETLDYFVSADNDQWQIEVSDKKVLLNKRNIYSQLAFVSTSEKPNHWRGELVLPHGIHYKMDLTIKDKVCIDDLDQWYSASAKLKLNNETLLGCVRTGGSVKSFVSGKYSNTLSSDQAFIVLNLDEDNSASLILDYRNGQPMIVNTGTWEMLVNQVVSVNLNASDSQLPSSVMLFQVFDSHELKLKGYSDLLGSELKLLPIQ